MRCVFVLSLLVTLATFTNGLGHDVCADFGKCCGTIICNIFPQGDTTGCAHCCRNLAPSDIRNMTLKNGNCSFRGLRKVCWCAP